MSSPVQGPGSPQHHQPSTDFHTPTKAGTHSGRTISVAQTGATLSQQSTKHHGPSTTSLAQRSVTTQSRHSPQHAPQLFTLDALKHAAGQTKGAFHSSNYKNILTSVEQFHRVPKSDLTQQIQKLDDVLQKAERFIEKKQGKTENPSQEQQQRIDGVKTLRDQARQVQASLTLKNFPPQSLQDVIAQTPLYQELRDYGGAELFELHLSQHPPQSFQDVLKNLASYETLGEQGSMLMEQHLQQHPPNTLTTFLEVAHMYTKADVATKHIKQLPETRGSATALSDTAKKIMGHSMKGPKSHINATQQAAALVWGEVKADILLQEVQRGSHKNLSAAKLAFTAKYKTLLGSPKQWPLSTALRALDQRFAEKSSGAVGETESLYANPKEEIALAQLEHVRSFGTQLENQLQTLPQPLHQTITRSLEDPGIKARFNDLPQVSVTDENNLFNRSSPRTFGSFSAQASMLPCFHASAATDGHQKAVYHANKLTLNGQRFIAAQGPQNNLENQGNYWKTLVGNNTAVSVDLTCPTDNDMNKRSVSYTPSPGQTQTYPGTPQTTVTNLGEVSILNGNVTVQKLEINGKQHTRIHYKNFHDRTSGNPAELVALAALVRNVCPSGGTIAAHCTAGVGRTGTFLVLMDHVSRIQNQQTLSETTTESAVTKFREARGNKGVQVASQLFTLDRVAKNQRSIAHMVKVLES